jgi:NAD-dependent DNA ligase
MADRASIPRGAIGYRLAHELEGVLTGIGADGVINRLEAERLVDWVTENAAFANIPPFSELAQHVERMLADGVLTAEECEDLLFVVRNYTTTNPYFDAIRGGIQQLMGVLSGVLADRGVNEMELAAMTSWLQSWSHLRGLWPYDECNAVVTAAVNGFLLPQHVEQLRALEAEFPIAGHATDPDIPLLVGGMCAVNPQVVFNGKTFVFTGTSRRAPRTRLAALVLSLGGVDEPNVTASSDYLVVCDAGSEFWAFSCYGRKVETAYQQRRKGHHILIVHESDFWNALVDQGITC